MGEPTAIQDTYPESVAYCYGCGRLNAHGLQIKSYVEGEETVCRFVPQPYHMAIPGYVYGGLIASLIDCHGTGTAAAASYAAEGRAPGTEPSIRFVTASLKVDYRRPTPLGPTLELRGRARAKRMGVRSWSIFNCSPRAKSAPLAKCCACGCRRECSNERIRACP